MSWDPKSKTFTLWFGNIVEVHFTQKNAQTTTCEFRSKTQNSGLTFLWKNDIRYIYLY